MRLILARILWAFDVKVAGKPVRWEDLRTFLLVEKKDIWINIKSRSG